MMGIMSLRDCGSLLCVCLEGRSWCKRGRRARWCKQAGTQEKYLRLAFFLIRVVFLRFFPRRLFRRVLILRLRRPGFGLANVHRLLGSLIVRGLVAPDEGQELVIDVRHFHAQQSVCWGSSDLAVGIGFVVSRDSDQCSQSRVAARGISTAPSSVATRGRQATAGAGTGRQAIARRSGGNTSTAASQKGTRGVQDGAEVERCRSPIPGKSWEEVNSHLAGFQAQPCPMRPRFSRTQLLDWLQASGSRDQLGQVACIFRCTWNGN